MKKGFLLILACTTLVCNVSARENNFGLGLMLGEPTVFTAKYWLGQKNALNFALGWSNLWGSRTYDNDGCYYEDGRCYNPAFYNDNRNYCDNQWRCDNRYYHGWRSIHLHVDYLFHNYKIFSTAEKLSLYYGPGLMVNFGDRYYYRYSDGYRDYRLGIRVPGGLDWVSASGHFNLFGELALVLIFAPRFDLRINGGVGARYFF